MATGSAAPSAVATPSGCSRERLDEWRALLDRHAVLSAALEKALQDKHGIGLSEFETLDRLVDANCGSYRMQDLAGDSHLSQSALSPVWRRRAWSVVTSAPTTAAASSSASPRPAR